MSTLSVTTLQGLASSPTPTKIEVASGHSLHAPGHVVQTAFQTFSTQTACTTDSNVDISGASLNFTPKFASSLLLLSYDLHVNLYRQSTTEQGGTINWVVDNVNISHANQDYENYNLFPSSGTFNDYRRIYKEIFISATNTNTKAIKLTGRPFGTSGAGQILVNISNDFTSSMKVQEIAQ